MSVDHAEVQKVLSSPPFIVVDGVINIRDVGGYPTAYADLFVKPSFVFRSGELTRITDRGIEQLHALKIVKVFDMRSDSEIASYKAEAPTIEGVEFVRIPISQKESYDPTSLALR
jgi:protein tyrosine/serine phosphatase